MRSVPPAHPWRLTLGKADAGARLDEVVDLRDVGLVAVGGALGAVARFALSDAWPTRPGGVPWATLAVNLVGAFAIGALLMPSGMEHGTRLFVAVGVLGGFTTLSTFSFEAVDLWRGGHAAIAGLYLAATGAGGPLMALAGWRLAVAFGAGSPAP